MARLLTRSLQHGTAVCGEHLSGRADLQDFRTLFAPKSSVLAEMLTMAPQDAEEAGDRNAFVLSSSLGMSGTVPSAE